jgi:hypothetical protein
MDQTMPAGSIDQPLDQLLETRSDVWRGAVRPARSVLSSGLDRLDARLPGGGWPCGQLIELLSDHPRACGLGVITPVMARQTQAGRPVLLAAPPLIPCPQALDRAGVRLDRLAVARPEEQALWAAEQGLKSGLCGVVAVWPRTEHLRPRAIRRLQLAAEQGPAPVFVCYRSGMTPPPSLATLRLRIRPNANVEILRATRRRDGEAKATEHGERPGPPALCLVERNAS